MKQIALLSLLILSSHFSTLSQESFAMIHNLLQTRCSGSGCHNGSTSTFNVDQSSADLYADLVNANPLNPTALAKGNKLIAPGYPARSFLLRKIAHGMSDVLEMQQPHEGSAMPDGGAPLEDHEVEMVRQWIMFGAPESGNVVDTALINTYYRDGGIDATIAQHDPPPAGQGFQMYMGRIFLPPLTEAEYFLKYDPKVSTGMEVPKLTTFLPEYMHHFVLYNFLPGTAGDFNDGLRDAHNLQEQDSHAVLQNPIPTGPGTFSYDLPAGTAYFWGANTVFDLNLHIKNSSIDSIMSTDMYINIHTQELGTTSDYMKVAFFPNFEFQIPQDNQEHVITSIATDSAAQAMWKVWSMVTHTHKYGTDYDVYSRNPDGSRGDQLYEGFYSYELDFNTGYYRTGPETTVLYYPDNDLLDVDPRHGLIHEAKFINTSGPDPVGWGLTSDDEMMVLSIQYIEGEALTGIHDPAPIQALRIYPNPSQSSFSISFDLLENAKVSLEIYDLVGQLVWSENMGENSSGRFNTTINTNEAELASGMYVLNLRINDSVASERIAINR